MVREIAVLPGDYIGPEIMDSALQVFRAAQKISKINYNLTTYPFGGSAIDQCGTPLPEETLNGAKAADAVLLAAVGGPKYDTAKIRPETGLLEIRKALNLYANIRPTKITASMSKYSPVKRELVINTDFVIVRELTSGIYFGEPRFLHDDEAIDTSRYKDFEIKRIIKTAFELANTRRKHVTVVDKANVLATSKLWRKITKEIAKDYPDIQVDYSYVDAASMKIVSRPTQFDVIVTANLFGDILSDEAAAVTGSIGTIASESKGVDGPNLYEPIHGSAPDIAGRGIADPIAMINSVVMMLENTFHDYLTAEIIEDALDETIVKGVLTPDFGGSATTQTMTDHIIQQINKKEE